MLQFLFGLKGIKKGSPITAVVSRAVLCFFGMTVMPMYNCVLGEAESGNAGTQPDKE
jgi:hypothetical protein